ncbi:sporulation histidine kinase inhibitor Sda [Halalkalibacter kiskunsagensis]|uniref:Sporulation histidine kinase inhibitor Sda n=1 Tax=Halalkalibacter kiskunsagensis TaxID=1548599 RepID=A0ABV6KGT4_9BACI
MLQISNGDLLEAYEKAVDMNLESSFIELFEIELLLRDWDGACELTVPVTTRDLPKSMKN